MQKNYNKHGGGLSVYRHILLILGFVLIGFSTLAQSQIIKGNVTAEGSSDGLPGVTILVKGSSNGTVTDIEGNYTLDISNLTDPILVFSFVGYIQQEVNVSSRSVVNVSLEEDVQALDEVVVVGYGVQQKKLLTGATGQVKGDDISKMSTTGSLEALQGQVAGVNITATSGQPGEGMRVLIRGAGTINNTGPMYLVDGIQTGDISYLNNSDIESIDVLKDAAAAAIYGSQAANGVVLITTKKGRVGSKPVVTFDSYYGKQAPTKKISMLNAQEYAVIMNEAAINSGKLPHFTNDEIAAMDEGTDWIDEMIYENAVTENYSLGISGGGQSSIYSLSLSYTNQEGIVGGTGISQYERYAFRVNTEHELVKDVVKLGQHLTFSYNKKNGVSVGNQYNNTLRGAFNTSPILPMYDDEGNFLNNRGDRGVMYNGAPWEPWAEGESNPYASMLYNNNSKNNGQKMLGDIYLEVTPIKNLTIKSRVAIDYYSGEGRSYGPTYELSIYSMRTINTVTQNMNNGLAWTFDNTISYDLNTGDHSLKFLVGSFAYHNQSTWLSGKNNNLLFNDLEHAYLNNATNTAYPQLNAEGAPNDELKLQSYFGRISYDFNEKYLFNATLRADGSSNFNKDNRWGIFPSVSAGWVVTNESFLESVVGLDFLKIRASWGQVGNQNVGAYQYLAPIHIGSGGNNNNDGNYYFGSEEYNSTANTVGGYPSRLANTEIQWEVSEQLNFGFDTYVFDSKLDIAFDWYNKQTKDWLVDAPGYATDGADAPIINGGSVKNTGIELGLTWNDNFGDINYTINATAAKNKNEVTEVPTDDGIIHGLTNQLYDNAGEFYHRAETGFPIGYFWGYETAGLFQNEGEVTSHRSGEGTIIQPRALPGDVRYVDQNNDGVINDADKVNIGDPNPDLTYSFSLGFEYKGFDFYALAYGVAGNQIVQSYRNQVNAQANYSNAILGRWHGEGTSNTIPRVTETNVNYQFSDLFVQDGDFLRINNITVGYDFSKMMDDGLFSKLRLYATVQNALTFTKYDGMDPEVGYGLENGSAGVDVGFYPRPRTYLLGLNVKF